LVRSPGGSREAAGFEIAALLHFAQGLFKRREGGLVKKNEVDFFQRSGPLQVFGHFMQHDGRALGKGKTADPGADRRKSDGAKSVFGGDTQRMGGGTAQGMARGQAAQLHTCRVNDVARLQLSGRGDGRAAQGNCADFVSFALHAISSFATNDTGETTAEFEVIIGGIDDGIGIHLGQITLLQNNLVGDSHNLVTDLDE
jgi:hypothetical protein